MFVVHTLQCIHLLASYESVHGLSILYSINKKLCGITSTDIFIVLLSLLVF